MLLILMYSRESLIELKNIYPAKIKPAVPRTLRAILIALIVPTSEKAICQRTYDAVLTRKDAAGTKARGMRFSCAAV